MFLPLETEENKSFVPQIMASRTWHAARDPKSHEACYKLIDWMNMPKLSKVEGRYIFLESVLQSSQV